MMDIQHQRVLELCNELRLGGVAAQYTALAQKAAEKHTSFTDFVEELLVAERESRRARAREMFARIACFPARTWSPPACYRVSRPRSSELFVLFPWEDRAACDRSR